MTQALLDEGRGLQGVPCRLHRQARPRVARPLTLDAGHDGEPLGAHADAGGGTRPGCVTSPTTLLLPLADNGDAGGVNRALIKAMGDLGPVGTASSRASPKGGEQAISRARPLSAARVTRVRCPPRPRPRSPSRVSAPTRCCSPAPDEQGDRWVPEVAAGEPRWPRSRSASREPVPTPPPWPSAPSRTAARWRLTGEKWWISNAPEADFYTVFARTTPGAGARGVTAFLVPADRPGLSGEPLDMLSPHPIGTLTFDGVPVAAEESWVRPDRASGSP